MKKSLLIISSVIGLVLNSANVFASESASENPIFQDKKNQIMVHGGLSIRGNGIEGYRVRSGDEKDEYKPNLGFGMISYSQPTEFFRLHARRSIEVGGIKGRKKGVVEHNNGTTTNRDFSEFDQGIFGVSEEVVLGWQYFYLTAGIGAYIKTKRDDRISSKFTFGERAGIGTSVGPANIEAYIRHFSNGSITEKNSGQNFVGLSAGFKF